ncbi:MAG TPA: O-antigen ligase family protein [Armatimonadota bacterium]
MNHQSGESVPLTGSEGWRRPEEYRDNKVRLPLGLLVGLLFTVALGIATAKFVVAAPVYFVFAAALAIVFALVFVRNLELGILIYFFIAALALGESPGVQSPNSGYKAGLMPSEVLLVFLVLLWGVRLILLRSRPGIVRAPLNPAILAFGMTAIAAMIAANLLRGSRELLFHQILITQIAEVGLLWLSIAAFFLTANGLKKASVIRRISVPVIILGIYYGTFHLLHLEMPVEIPWGGFILAAAIAFVYSKLLFEEMGRTKKIWFGVMLVGMLAAAYSDMSWISGWLAVSMVLFVISLYKSRVLALVLVIFACVYMFGYPGKFHEIQQESAQGGDYDRFVIWHDAFAMFTKVNPILGVGPGNYNPFVYYHSTLWWGNSQKTYTTAHNNLVGIAAEQGFLGLFVFLWVIASAIITGHRSVRGSPAELKWLGIAATALFAGMTLACIGGDYLFPSRGNNGLVNFGTTVYTWLIMGAAVAASGLGHQEESSPQTDKLARR